MLGAKIHTEDTPDFQHIIRDENDYIVDISGATSLVMRLLKPDGTVLFRTALLTGDGTDGVMHYQTSNLDLDIQGDWARQVHITTLYGEWSGRLFKFTVNRKIG